MITGYLPASEPSSRSTFILGLNLVVQLRRTVGQRRVRTRNSSGKSSLVEIIHFVWDRKRVRLDLLIESQLRGNLFRSNLMFAGDLVARCERKSLSALCDSYTRLKLMAQSPPVPRLQPKVE